MPRAEDVVDNEQQPLDPPIAAPGRRTPAGEVAGEPGELARATRRVDALARLLEVSKRINSTLELHETVDHIIESAKDVMSADAASLMLREGDELVFEVALGEASEALSHGRARLPITEGIAGYVARTGESLRFDDVYDDPRFNRSFDEETGFRTRSMLCVPLMVDERVIGVAQVINKVEDGEVRPFSETDLGTFTTFCGMAAIAVEKAKLHLALLDRQRMARELELARTIQQSFLPRHFPRQDVLRCAATNVPASEVGGDFYDAFELPDGRLGLAIGDVTGKGTVAALHMARFMSEFRFIAELAEAPEAAVARANALLAARSTRGMFVTFVYVCVAPETGRVQLVNAGHPAPVRYGPSHDVGAWGAPSGPPLGIVPDHGYAATETTLRPGDGLVLYTDGVIEARDRRGAEYGQERLVERVTARPAFASGEGVLEAVLGDVRQFVDGSVPHDDLTLMTVEAIADAR